MSLFVDTTSTLSFYTEAGAGTNLSCTASLISDPGQHPLAYVTPLVVHSNGATPVTISVAATGDNTLRFVAITNEDTVSRLVTVQIVQGVTTNIIVRRELRAGQTLQYTPAQGWFVEREDVATGTGLGTVRTIRKTGTAAEAAASWYGFAKDGGIPGAQSVGSPGVNGRAVYGSTESGAQFLPTPAGSWLMRTIAASMTVLGTPLVYDLVWINSGLDPTNTGAQAITTPAFPARDDNGSAAGQGYQIGLYFVTNATNVAAITNSTISYTNSAGTPGRTARLINVAGSVIPATPVAGTIVWFALDTGDVGVQSIESISLGTSLVTGTISLFVARWLSTPPLPLVNVPVPFDYGDQGVNVWDDPALFLAYQAAATTALTTNVVMTFEDR